MIFRQDDGARASAPPRTKGVHVAAPARPRAQAPADRGTGRTATDGGRGRSPGGESIRHTPELPPATARAFELADESPFERASVSAGYPLDRAERAALDAARLRHGLIDPDDSYAAWWWRFDRIAIGIIVAAAVLGFVAGC